MSSSSNKKARTSTSIEDLPEYPGGMGYGPYLGFAFQNGIRYKLRYASELEQAWAETSELCDQSLWKEAEKRLGQYEDLCIYAPDVKLQLRVRNGVNNALMKGGKMSKAKAIKEFNLSIRMIQYELSSDGGSNYEEILEKLETTICNHYNYLIPKCENDSSSSAIASGTLEKLKNIDTSTLVQAGKVWLIRPKILKEDFQEAELSDDGYDNLREILEELLNRKAFKEVQSLSEELFKIIPCMKEVDEKEEDDEECPGFGTIYARATKATTKTGAVSESDHGKKKRSKQAS